MNKLELKVVLIGIILGAVIMFSGCECIDLYYPDDPIEEPIQPLSIQALECGGAGNNVGDEDLNWQWIMYTDTSGQKVIGHYIGFYDTLDNFLFSTKFGNYEINENPKKGYIVEYDLTNPDMEKYYKLELMEIQDTSDPEEKLYLFHQWKEAPGINGTNAPFAANDYFNGTPVKIPECEDWSVLGDLKGIILE